MIRVHHLENSRSQRVLWLLEELGLPYEVVRYKRNPLTMLAPPELRAIHPLGKSPIISDGNKVVAESGAIIEYLVETYGQGGFQPALGTPERLRYRYWLHYAEGSAMTPLLLKLVFSRLPKAKMPFFIRPIAQKISDGAQKNFIDPQIKQHLDFMEAEMVGRTWVCGDEFSAADVQLSFPLEASSARGGLEANYPLLKALISRMHARPAYRRALEMGGPYELMR